jgi:rhodanese-related sulfurtransferase
LAASNLETLLRQKKAVLLDVREREPFNHGHTAGARNIPLAELPPRARFELDAGLIAVVDYTVVSPAACDAAVGLLSTHHPEVAVSTLGRKSGASVCAGNPGLAGETGGAEDAPAK